MKANTFLFSLALLASVLLARETTSSYPALQASIAPMQILEPVGAVPQRTAAESAASVTPENYAYPELNVLRYGKNSTPGTTDMTKAFRAAITVAKQFGGGGDIYVPRGNYKITSTLALDADHLHLRGAGIGSTRLIFAPNTDATLLEIGSTHGMRSHGSISELTLYSNDSKHRKIGIDAIDISGWDIRNVAIHGSVAAGNSRYWSGAGSIGIRTRGRELTRLGPLYIYADMPIQFADNPSSSIDIDHFHFEDNMLVGNGFPIVTINGGVNLSNVTFDGYQAWAKGTDGLNWVDSSTSHTSLKLTLRNVRWEQGAGARNFLVRIEHNYGLQGLLIDNCYGGVDRSGFRLRKVTSVSIANTYYTGGVGYTALDVDATVKQIGLWNDFWQTGAGANLAQMRNLATPKTSGSSPPLPSFAYYEDGASTESDPKQE